MASQSAAELAFAIQSAKGSPAASSTERLYLTGGSSPGPQKVARADGANSTTRIALGPIIGSVYGGGSPTALVRPEWIGAMLYAALGGKAVAGAGDPFTHTFTLGASLPYLTVWRHAAGILNERLLDARVARLVISGSAGQPLQAAVDLIAPTVAYRTAKETTAAAESADALLFRHGAGALKVEGTAVASINDFSLTIETGVALVETLAGPVPMLTGPGSITLLLEQALADVALWNRLVYGSASPANLAPATVTPLELVGSPAGAEFTFTEQAGPERSLRLALPRLAVMAPPAGFDPNAAYQPARQRLSLQAFAPASGSPLTATLKNAVSAY